ncbi:MAG TPA: MOSC domain-containing protein [Pyrinomonadaceae bacterium]|nr:MOSC domain-containing protein [Pyrinomonadaceae bacterium]
MNVLSINVGMPRIVEYRGEPLATGIFKEPVSGKIAVREFNLDGDGQADLRVHGGYYKSVYVYPSEHYEFWRRELPDVELPWGVFGENLTTEGILESDVRPGDRLRIGSAEFLVTQPRYPCYKLGIRFAYLNMNSSSADTDGTDSRRNIDILRRFTKSGRSGFYLAVERTGELAAGDNIELTAGENDGKTIAEIFNDRVSAKNG